MIPGLKHRFRPGFLLGILLMWCMLMGEFTVANVVGGLLVGLVVVLALPLPAMPEAGLSISWGRLVVFAARWCADLVRASCMVAWLAIRPQDPPRSAIVQLPMRVDSELILATAVGLYNLQPGGTVTEIDIANRMLTIHLLAADTEEQLAREIAAVRRLEADLIAIFERSPR